MRKINVPILLQDITIRYKKSDAFSFVVVLNIWSYRHRNAPNLSPTVCVKAPKIFWQSDVRFNYYDFKFTLCVQKQPKNVKK